MDSALYIYHLVDSLWGTFPTQSCLILYSFCATLLHSLNAINCFISVFNQSAFAILLCIIIFFYYYYYQQQGDVGITAVAGPWDIDSLEEKDFNKVNLSILIYINIKSLLNVRSDFREIFLLQISIGHSL